MARTQGSWRLLVDGAHAGAENMARDEALALNASRGATLRVYRFEPPAITVGRFQRFPGGIDVRACALEGIEVVRRPTGGLAILHLNDFTYSVVAPAEGTGAVERDRHFDLIADSLVAALDNLGIEAVQARHESRQVDSGDWCFQGVFGVDLEWRGRKICGSAQRLFAGSVLQHGSLFLSGPGDKPERISRCGATAVSEEARFATLEEAAGRVVGWSEVLEAFKKGFVTALGMALEPGEMGVEEAEEARRLAVAKYSNKRWLEGRERTGGPE